jgi:hypothetical protein
MDIHPYIIPTWVAPKKSRFVRSSLGLIDTIGIKIGPFSMIDSYGTPYTEALHVVERYRFIDNKAATEARRQEVKPGL